MNILIVYHSEHHGNTKKLLDAIARQGGVTLLDASAGSFTACEDYDIIGFASGIYYHNFHKDVLAWAEKFLPEGKTVFFLYTCGVKRKCYTNAISRIAAGKRAQIVGVYSCPGYDTFGPFKLVGGIAKNRPNAADMDGAVRFLEGLL